MHAKERDFNYLSQMTKNQHINTRQMEFIFLRLIKQKNFLIQKKKQIKVIGSAHSQKEIQKKIQQNCEAIFLSPIFNVKKSKSYLNLYKFNNLSRLNKTNILALGGISEKNIRQLKLLCIKGFGGISLIKKKTGRKEAGFHKE